MKSGKDNRESATLRLVLMTIEGASSFFYNISNFDLFFSHHHIIAMYVYYP